MAASVPSLLLDADGRGRRGGTRGTGKAAVMTPVLSSTPMVEAAEAGLSDMRWRRQFRFCAEAGAAGRGRDEGTSYSYGPGRGPLEGCTKTGPRYFTGCS
jgi:hypothetical protein